MFKNLPTSTKLLILCGMFVIAIAATTYSLLVEQRIDIVFARKKLVGSRYLASIREIYLEVLAAQTSGATDPTLKPDLTERLVRALDAAQAAAGPTLQTATPGHA